MRTVGAALLAQEPFYRELRRRHDDVDIVVLARQEPAPTEPVGIDVARRAAVQTREVFDEIWGEAIGEPAAASVHWRPGTVTGVVLSEVAASAPVGDPDGLRLLRRVDDALTARGWDVRSHAEGVPRVLAGHDDMTIRLTWWDDTVTLTVQGPGTSVGAQSMRELMAEDAA